MQPAADPAAAATVPAKPTILVPQSAIVSRDGGPKVFEVVDGRAKMRAITTGATRNDAVVVTDGLAGSELLISRPGDALKDGASVSVKQ
jgi:multidrug efflux pump subunit AcrA (membrane-fusion protein)